MRLAIIERIWRTIKRRRLVYTAMNEQGKTSNAVAPLAEYRYRPKKRQEAREAGEVT